jgi:excisionase family DNA binding protein
MAARSAKSEATTYLLDSSQLAEVVDLRAALQARGVAIPEHPPALVDTDGRRMELPPAVFEALRQVVLAMSEGLGVTIAPHHAMLTTQEAADFLGISRPTLVRILQDGEIAYQKPGRHRRVMLSDLVEYQATISRRRREALQELVDGADTDGLYEATSGPPVPTR